MEKDLQLWFDDAVKAAKSAIEKGVLVLLRNDDYQVIVTNAVTSDVVTALGEALATGYTHESTEN